MRSLLQIGEVARLVGVTPKTVRHYHHVGLLAEPPRADNGYRLYAAAHLLRLQRIRRLQALGLSLKQIRSVLGSPDEERSLRSVLEALHAEVSKAIRDLEERRARIAALLAAETLDTLDQSPELPSALRLAQEHLGEHLTHVSPALWEQDKKLFALLDDFQWPGNPHDQVASVVRYLADHPEAYTRGLALAEHVAALASVPADSPEIERVVEEYIAYAAAHPFPQAIQPLASGGPFADVMAEVMTTTFAESPAQRRFLEELTRRMATPEGDL